VADLISWRLEAPSWVGEKAARVLLSGGIFICCAHEADRRRFSGVTFKKGLLNESKGSSRCD